MSEIVEFRDKRNRKAWCCVTCGKYGLDRTAPVLRDDYDFTTCFDFPHRCKSRRAIIDAHDWDSFQPTDRDTTGWNPRFIGSYRCRKCGEKSQAYAVVDVHGKEWVIRGIHCWIPCSVLRMRRALK